MVDIECLAVLVVTRVHGLPVTVTAGIRASLGQGTGVLIGEFELPLVNLAQSPGIALIGKGAELLDGVSAPALGVANRGGNGA